MNRALAMLIIGLVFGGGLGFILAAANNATLDGHDHATDHGPMTQTSEHSDHAHGEVIAVPAGADAPTLQAKLSEDPVSGWNLEVVTTGFSFAPENSGQAHVPGQGHAHLYVNGEKIARLYGPWVHIGNLPEGEAVIEVTLNSNDHRTLAVGDTPLSAKITVQN